MDEYQKPKDNFYQLHYAGKAPPYLTQEQFANYVDDLRSVDFATYILKSL